MLRHLALEAGGRGVSVPDRLELAFLERQGLAAWVEVRLAGNRPADFQEAEMRESVSTPDGLVLALADLVLGSRQEVRDG